VRQGEPLDGEISVLHEDIAQSPEVWSVSPRATPRVSTETLKS